MHTELILSANLHSKNVEHIAGVRMCIGGACIYSIILLLLVEEAFKRVLLYTILTSVWRLKNSLRDEMQL